MMEYEVGQIAYVREASYSSYERAYSGKVVKVTPSGQIVVERAGGAQVRFDARGTQIGSGSTWYKDDLITYERFAEIVKGQQVRDRQKAAFAQIEKLRPKSSDSATVENLTALHAYLTEILATQETTP